MGVRHIVAAVAARSRESITGRDRLGRPMPPGPQPDPILGHLRGIQNNAPEFLMRSFLEHGDVVSLALLGLKTYLLSHPDHIDHVLRKRVKNYNKQTRGYDALRTFLGNGLVTSEGSSWLRQRRIAQPAFHRRRVANFAPTMVNAIEDMLDSWEPKAARGEVIDVAEAMMKVTMRIAGETLLSTDPSDAAESISESLEIVLREANYRINNPLALPPSLPFPQNFRVKAAMAKLEKVVLDIIERRRRGAERKDDLLQMLLEARDEETGEGMSNKQLRDEVMTLFLAGHETTSNMLSWTLFLLARAPAQERRAAEEAKRVLGDRRATIEDLPKLEFIQRVLHESLRLRPPIWILARMVVEDDEIDGHVIEKGSLVFISPWVVHRHPGFWESPEGFDPDRFLPERMKNHHRSQYFPFSTGPRICIGEGFALMEGALLLASMLRRYRFDLVPGAPVQTEALVTLRPKGGLPMTLHRR